MAPHPGHVLDLCVVRLHTATVLAEFMLSVPSGCPDGAMFYPSLAASPEVKADAELRLRGEAWWCRGAGPVFPLQGSYLSEGTSSVGMVCRGVSLGLDSLGD